MLVLLLVFPTVLEKEQPDKIYSILSARREKPLGLSRVAVRTWRNWYTRMLEVHMPKGLEVQVLSSAPRQNTF